MASYQSRDPLFDSAMQAMIEKRGKELFGLVLVGLGVLVGLCLITYSPTDPSWASATGAPIANMMGRTGASIAGPLMLVLGYGSLALPLTMIAWGLRFVTHLGEERALMRLLPAVILPLVLSIYCATLAAPASWAQHFGLGGILGDTVLAVLLSILPVSLALNVKLWSVALFALTIWVGVLGLGFTWAELKRAGRFLLIGLVMTYAGVLKLMGMGAGASARAARAMQARAEARRAAAAEAAALEAAYADEYAYDDTPQPAAPRVRRAEPALEGAPSLPVAPEHRAEDPAPLSEEPAAKGLFARMPSLLRRDPAPELVEDLIEEDELDLIEQDDDRIRNRINDAIRNRMRGAAVAPGAAHAARATPPLTGARPAERAEPTLTGAIMAKRRGPAPLVADAPASIPPAPEAVSTEIAQPEIAPTAAAYAPQETIAPAPQPVEPALTNQPGPEGGHAPVKPTALSLNKVVQHQVKRSIAPSRQAQAEAQPSLKFDETQKTAFETPPLSLLTNPTEVERHHLSDEALEENARMLETVLDDYGVKGEIVSVRPGPVVTMYELEPAPGLKASRVIGLSDDIARSMSALSARVSTVPGRSVIGIELPNEKREMVVLREMLAARDFGDGNQRLPLALGKDIGGDPVIANLAKMPHLLIAGTTGSGKSVAINTMILSLLYKLTPEECRLIMIDPKMLELSVYDGIPHLLSPVVTDPKKAVVALKWTVGEMEERYRKMSKMGVRNIEGYNSRVRDALSKGEMFERTVQTGFDEETGDPIFETEQLQPEAMPYIVVIVDEMADLMMVAGKEIEACIQRLAQMARASGIHLIMATQRPSVDVITGTIKANFPTRISFQVTSKVDSRTILGEQGAEQLLGMGDMLYMAGGAKITRVHGPFVSDEEVEEIVTYLKQFGPPDYKSGVVEGPEEDKASNIDAVLGLGGNTDGEDALYDQAVQIVAKDRKCSTSYIQRKLAIGYNKAARLVEQMEDEGVVSAANHVGKREVLVPEIQ